MKKITSNNYKLQAIGLYLLLLLTSCGHPPKTKTNPPIAIEKIDTLPTPKEEMVDTLLIPKEEIADTFGRKEILTSIQTKIQQQEPLVIHIFIPLCDNIHQGIVPTTQSLGDGQSIRSNLYWATSSGTKKFFQKHKEWKQIYIQQDIDSSILERVVFERTYQHTKVYLVADAYRGDRMGKTLNDFLAALSMNKKESLSINSDWSIPISSNADLLIFNGHNGLMDNPTMESWKNSTSRRVDAVINACVSFDYFEEELKEAKAYPLIRTTTLLHPGAYVLTQIIDDWVNLQPQNVIRRKAGRAYCMKHKCGSGSKVYATGWQR